LSRNWTDIESLISEIQSLRNWWTSSVGIVAIVT
jgi:hypothetical protein